MLTENMITLNYATIFVASNGLTLANRVQRPALVRSLMQPISFSKSSI